jgi:putative acetyltransferase
MEIRRDDLRGPEIKALLEEHLRSMYELSPPESVHALDLEKLRRPEITFWTAWKGRELLGCGALKELDPAHGEAAPAQRRGGRDARAHRRRGEEAQLPAPEPGDGRAGRLPAGAAPLRAFRFRLLRAVR